jgi:lipopolysaccharide/colanic/teichoic acid biosynthesis glycosyltransferase
VNVSTKTAPQAGLQQQGSEIATSLNSWNYSAGKRAFDLIFSGLLILVTLPFWLIAAVSVKLTSPGPVFFCQKRVGQGGNEFPLLKFRTMTYASQPQGPGLTRKGDQRVTTVGSILRRTKLDELPQLINVLRGEMSIIGPRPDLQQYVQTLSPKLQPILTLRPGLTGCASVKFRNEEEALGKIPENDLLRFYTEELLPNKIQLDLNYARTANFVTDIRLVFQTITAVLIKAS